MRVLLIGGGGREHALAAKMLESPGISGLWWLPGNGALEGRAVKVTGLDPCDGPRIATYARHQAIDLAVVGPEAPLLAGVADCLEEVGVPCFGPSRAAARLEGSKAFAKELMKNSGVPTARYQVAENAKAAVALVDQWGAPVVVKADGLAAGKGVTVAMTLAEAREAAAALEGPAVIEEYLEGRELSFMVLAQGRDYVSLVPSRDHKRIGEGDTGPNTGGMGAVAGFHLLDQALLDQIGRRIIQPTLNAMADRGCPFRGLLYAGLMLTTEGPKVLEFNVRFGDPETQAVLPLWEDDLLEVLNVVARGGLPTRLMWSGMKAVSVVAASKGYPGNYTTGHPIRGLDQLPPGVELFQAGTAATGQGIVTAGGRVLAVTATAPDIEAARKRAYAAVERLEFQGMYYRRDIGL